MASSLLEGKRFFCRQWAFLKLAHSLDQRPLSRTCGTMVVGGPGTGKTSLCCQIVFNPGANGRTRNLHNRLLAHHFCQAHDVSTLSLTRFILNVVSQLMSHASSAHDEDATSPSSPTAQSYAEKIRSDPDILAALSPENLDRDPDESFKRAVLFPILEIEAPKQTLFLLVDSIDEVAVGAEISGRKPSGGPSKTIAELLSNHHHLFPQWLVLVCTARKQSKSIARMFTGFRKISLDDLRKSAVVRDVQQYILARLDREQSLRQHISRDTAEMLNQLHIKSNGCFLYLEKVLDGVSENFVVLREVREIPGTLNGLYLWLCQRLFNRKQFAKVQPLLNVMLASTRALTADELYRCVWTGNIGMTREDFNKRLHLLRRVLITSSTGSLLPFHHSFAEWLLDVKHCTKKFLCNTAEGHAMIAMSLTLRAADLPLSEVHELALHLTRLPSAAPLPAGPPVTGSTTALDDGAPDQQLLATLWLVHCGAPVEDSLTQGEVSLSPDSLFGAVSLPKDPRVVSLLVDAGATREQQVEETEENMVSSQISVEEAVTEDPLAELDALTLSSDGSGRTVLHSLAAEGNATLLQLALTRGGDLEATDRHGQTALNLAARHGHGAVVRLLLEAGAAVDHADCDGWTALRAAAWGGHLQVVECLLGAGAEVDCCDSDQRTALRAAAWGGHQDIVLALLQAGASPNKADDEGRTALIAAAYMGHADIVSHLLEFGAHMDHADSDGRTALSVAALCVPNNEGAAKVVALLLERGAKVDHQDKDGMTPLLVAAFEGHRDVCELLLEWDADVDVTDRAGRSPLWAACSMGHAPVVTLLLFWGCSVDCIDQEGRTVLSVAAAQGSGDVVRRLLDRGLDEQHRDNSGWSPLHYAAFEGHYLACEALLESGARVETPDNDGKGALLLAAQEGHTRIVRLLLDHGAPPDQRAHDGKTALRLSSVEGHSGVAQCLVSAGADVNYADADGRSTLYVLALDNRLEMARVLIDEAAADIHSRDSEGRTPLHVSSWQGHAEMVALLLSSGADVNAVDLESRTALQSASWQGHDKVVKILLENGAEPDHTCSQGATALGIAAQEGHEACVRALLQHGADPNHSDRCGRNARKIAAKSGHDAVLRLLEECAVATGGGGSSSTSCSTTETKPSSALLVCQTYSPVESPDSAKRRSLQSLGNHSSNSSNLTNSTKSSLEQPQPAANNQGGVNLSFTQQLQQCSRGRGSLSKLLQTEEATSPIYNSPPHSPLSDVAAPTSASNKLSLMTADPHFARDTHMRIILGSAASAVSRGTDHNGGGSGKPKRNGIVTNPALRIVAGMRNGLDRTKLGSRNQTQPAQHWRKETPL